MVSVKHFAAAAVLAVSASAQAAQVLRPQNVVDAVLVKSFDAVEIGLKAQDGYVRLEKALGKYDLKIKADVGYEYDEAESLSGLTNPIDKTLTSNLTLEKTTSLGAEFEFGYKHEAQSSVLNPIVINTRTSRAALDAAFFEWRQKLWGNSFGAADRLELEVARSQLKNADLNKQEETEELVLKALRAFWDAFVAQTQLQDAITARQQYKNLIGVVQKRGRFGLDKGGEYAQVMADYTDADNKVKTASYDYLDKLKALEILMQTSFAEDVQFEAGDLVPALPKLQPVNAEGLRKIRIAESTYRDAKSTERAIVWRGQPDLDLVAKASSTGVDEKASSAYSEFVSGNKPTYFVGLEFSASFDSSVKRAALAEARVKASRELNSLSRTKMDVTKSLTLLDRKLEESFVVASGSLEAEKFRSRTVREQEVEYRQGRLPLRDLLQTYRMYFDAQAKKVRAIGDYHIALNEMAAERDELVR